MIADGLGVLDGVGGFVRNGEVFAGRFKLEGLLGRGGMGEVWRARDLTLRRDVAVKILLDSGQNREVAERFRREASIAARLRHPAVTAVHDIGDDNGRLFIVMELLHGEDLAELVARAPAGLPVDQVVDVSVQALRALAAAHAQGVVHRDVKPQNLFVQRDGTVKVCDFGIARIADATSDLTATGSRFGTPAYMAPEQWRAEEVDARCDLYAFGCVLYALLTGAPPFPVQGSPYALMGRHLNEPPEAPSRRRPGLPEEWDALVLSLLAKDPDARPRSANEVADALEQLGPRREPDPAPSVHATDDRPDDGFVRDLVVLAERELRAEGSDDLDLRARRLVKLTGVAARIDAKLAARLIDAAQDTLREKATEQRSGQEFDPVRDLCDLAEAIGRFSPARARRSLREALSTLLADPQRLQNVGDYPSEDTVVVRLFTAMAHVDSAEAIRLARQHLVNSLSKRDIFVAAAAHDPAAARRALRLSDVRKLEKIGAPPATLAVVEHLLQHDHDPVAAERYVRDHSGELDTVTGWRSLMAISDALASSDPGEAVRVAKSITAPEYRAAALAGVAAHPVPGAEELLAEAWDLVRETLPAEIEQLKAKAVDAEDEGKAAYARALLSRARALTHYLDHPADLRELDCLSKESDHTCVVEPRGLTQALHRIGRGHARLANASNPEDAGTGPGHQAVPTLAQARQRRDEILADDPDDATEDQAAAHGARSELLYRLADSCLGPDRGFLPEAPLPEGSRTAPPRQPKGSPPGIRPPVRRAGTVLWQNSAVDPQSLHYVPGSLVWASYTACGVLDPVTGAARWMTDLYTDEEKLDYSGADRDQVVLPDLVVTAVGVRKEWIRISAWDLADGQLLWRHDLRRKRTEDVARLRVMAADDRVVVITNTKVTALNTSTGAPVWGRHLDQPSSYQDSTAIGDGRLFLLSDDIGRKPFSGLSGGSDVLALSLKTGRGSAKPLYSLQRSRIFSFSEPTGGPPHILNDLTHVHGIEGENGGQIWCYWTDRLGRIKQTMDGEDGSIYVLALDGPPRSNTDYPATPTFETPRRPLVASLDATTGTPRWQTRPIGDQPIEEPFVIALIGTHDGHLYLRIPQQPRRRFSRPKPSGLVAYDSTTGRPAWHHTAMTTGPAVIGDGYAFGGSPLSAVALPTKH